MRPFRYVYYAKLHLKLDGVLRVGDGDENGIGLAMNARGEFLMPASGIAGAVRHGIASEKADAAYYFGTKDERDSKIYFYDAICNSAHVERRVGVKIDSRYGVAESRKLYNTFYLGDGFTTELRLQCFAEDEKEKHVIEEIVLEIAQGIASGKITFGAKTSTGAGLFTVTDFESLMLDLSRKSETGKLEDLDLYLDGVDVCFNRCGKKDLAIEGNLNDLTGDMDMFRLTAEIPDALLVKSGELSDVANDVNMNHLVYVDGCQSSDPEYYIPGSSIKGLFRSYSETICKIMGLEKKLDSETDENLVDILLNELYGSKNETNNDKYKINRLVEPDGDSYSYDVESYEERGDSKKERKASKILFKDVPIKSPKKVLHSRIKIDRWLGGAMETAKMSEELLSTDGSADKDGTLDIEVRIVKIIDDRLRAAAKALVFLTCRDLARGVIPVGSGSSQGLGRLEGCSIYIDNERFQIKNGKLEITDEKKANMQSWLDSLSVLGNLTKSGIKEWWKTLKGVGSEKTYIK